MHCNDARQLMLALLDGDPERRLRRHLSGCPDCATEWAGLAAVEALLRSQSLVDPPEGFAERVIAALDLPARRRATWQRRVMEAAWIATGILVMASGFASLISGWHGVVQDPRSEPVVAALATITDQALALVIAAARDGILLWVLYGLLAVAMALFWFGALVVPRYVLRPTHVWRPTR